MHGLVSKVVPDTLVESEACDIYFELHIIIALLYCYCIVIYCYNQVKMIYLIRSELDRKRTKLFY